MYQVLLSGGGGNQHCFATLQCKLASLTQVHQGGIVIRGIGRHAGHNAGALQCDKMTLVQRTPALVGYTAVSSQQPSACQAATSRPTALHPCLVGQDGQQRQHVDAVVRRARRLQGVGTEEARAR